jgi:hypothetical protein
MELDERHYYWSLHHSFTQWRMLASSNTHGNSQMKNSRNSKATIQIVLGAIAAITLNAFIFTIIFLLFLNFTRSPTFLEKSMLNLASIIGLSQLIYIIPLAILLKQQRQKYWMQGVIIGACITALINGGCWAMNSF